MSAYVYIPTNRGFAVGFYDSVGKFQTESDHPTREKAAEQIHYLNGGNVIVSVNHEGSLPTKFSARQLFTVAAWNGDTWNSWEDIIFTKRSDAMKTLPKCRSLFVKEGYVNNDNEARENMVVKSLVDIS